MGKDNNRGVGRTGKANGSSGGIANLRGDVGQSSNGLLQFGGRLRFCDAVDRVIEVGDALIIGRTRDGGAVCVTILSGSDREKLYAGTDEELEAMIESVIDAYTAAEINAGKH